MTRTAKVIWVTGAGRSGTNLVGMMVDGHPEVNVFPYELRIVAHWQEASAWVSQDGGQTLPGSLLNKMLVTPHLKKPRFEKLQIDAARFAPMSGSKYGFFSYIETLNKAIFLEPTNAFLYRAPGSQLAFFLKKAQDEHADNVHVLLILRDPVQNYLSQLSHDLQKGLGYRNEAVAQPQLGLPTIMHASLLRVLRAFRAAKNFASDKRVTITMLEKFTADGEERKRVWSELGIAVTDSLQELTRVGETSISNSGKWRTTEIQSVQNNEYALRLSRAEHRALKKSKALFAPYYDEPLEGVEVVAADMAGELLMQREVDSLTNNQNAHDKRRQRIRSSYAIPGTLRDWVRWPGRAVRTLREDVMFYPQARIRRMNNGHAGLDDGLEEIPELFGILLDDQRGVY